MQQANTKETSDINKKHPLFDSIERAVFVGQCKNVSEVIRFIRPITGQKNFNPATIAELITFVSTSYKVKDAK